MEARFQLPPVKKRVELVGIGLGTVLAMILVGRVIALFNHLVGTRLLAMAGMVGAQRRSAPAPRPGTADA